ncbi:hypothetical protein FA15DRAFT_752355 [Coprinopsis marcescibilis]|uniref:Uncharacterized protein n=1 Tax=Coprinopsis marcescibilis TaxID=230819 RepID=A0A5C3LEA2_COPMA|nr:hypothetical protein FA15DRAFT_752355 [Coprinopsis marcescibilis]
MGFLDSVTGFFGGVADNFFKAVAPGLEFKPSSLISQAAKLLPTIVNAIPGVGRARLPPLGPLLSKAIPAVDAIFGGTDQKIENGRVSDQTIVPKLDEIKSMLGETISAIQSARDDLENKLKASEDRGDALRRLETFTRYKDKVIPAIKYMQTNMETLQSFIPYGGNDHIKDFVPKDNHGVTATELTTHHYELKSAIENLEEYLWTDIGAVTQELFDLYILIATWLLTYDKTVLTLRSYLAQHYFGTNSMSNYIAASRSWNNDYKINASSRSTFILGYVSHNGDQSEDRKKEGFAQALSKVRLNEIKEVLVSTQEGIVTAGFADAYSAWAIGYARLKDKTMTTKVTGQPNQTVESVKEQAEDLRVGYYGTQAAYMEACLRPAVELAKVWRRSVFSWQRSLPLTPPFDATNVAKIEKVVKLKETEITEANQKGTGYKTGENITYAVSYVTTAGEGFLSGWSQPKNITQENRFIKVELNPIVFPKSGLEDYPDAEKPDNGLEPNIVRRVYVKKVIDDVEKIFHVEDVTATAKEVKFIWDQAHQAHPKIIHDDDDEAMDEDEDEGEGEGDK